jgi:adenine C2-methylase RlmN of 23S rRNA A2503 and tRNA A37
MSTSADAQALARLLATRRAHVNLIRYNPVAGLPFDRPDPESVARFVAILRDRGVSVTVRKTKGRAIDAACGQLRRRLDPDRDPTPPPESGRARDRHCGFQLALSTEAEDVP